MIFRSFDNLIFFGFGASNFEFIDTPNAADKYLVVVLVEGPKGA